MTNSQTFATKNDLAHEVRVTAIALLNQHLADMADLCSQIKQAHWNVKGMQFFQLHELFDRLADEVCNHVDLIAERSTAIGGTAVGTVRMSAASSRISEYPLYLVDGRQHVEALATRFSSLAKTTRAAIDAAFAFGDADTADVFTEVSRSLDKALWFLEAHLPK